MAGIDGRAPTMQAIVFTDLDATLLDHLSYDWRPAQPALDLLRERGIPVVMVTSKTRSEVEMLREETGIRDPFVVENGAAIFFPEEWASAAGDGAELCNGYRALVLGCEYRQLRRFLETLPEELGVEGFGDWTVEEVAAHTGLDLERARLARSREFTEPFRLASEEALPRVDRLAREAGLRITRGGRFFHLMGEAQDKGRAVTLAVQHLSAGCAAPPTTIGLGDSPNDLPMLDRVDLAIVIPHEEGARIAPSGDQVEVASAPGPHGWNQAVTEVLNRLDPISGSSGGDRSVL